MTAEMWRQWIDDEERMLTAPADVGSVSRGSDPVRERLVELCERSFRDYASAELRVRHAGLLIELGRPKDQIRASFEAAVEARAQADAAEDAAEARLEAALAELERGQAGPSGVKAESSPEC